MTSLASFLQDPPPAYAFELSEAGIACARVGEPAQVKSNRKIKIKARKKKNKI
jgi:hypothetical protein